MRAPNQATLLLYLVLDLLLPMSSAITLSQYQQVAGFSKACTNAYNTPLTSCTSSDFVDGQACSLQCINFLKDLTVSINNACKGEKAFPETLIGMMFSGDAVAVLCPNALPLTTSKPVASSTDRDGDGTRATDAKSTLRSSSPIGLMSSITQSPTTAASKPSIGVFSSTPGSSITPAATSSALETIDTSTTVLIISTTIESGPEPTVLPPESTVPLSALTAISSSTRTPVTKPTSSSQKQKSDPEGTGGGTLFDITSSSCHNAKTLWWARSILLGSLTLVFMI